MIATLHRFMASSANALGRIESGLLVLRARLTRSWVVSGFAFLPASFVIGALSPLPAHSAPAGAIGLPSLSETFTFDPRWSWRTIESEHFRVSYVDGLHPLAERASAYFERAHALLSPFLRWEPTAKTQVLLVDNADSANGATLAVARYGIVLLSVPPETALGTYHYEDWLWLLVLHEYAHFLNMDPTRELWKVARLLFGDLVLPNSLLPAWMLEGLAVYVETRMTGAGRGRSPYFEMILRAAVEAKVFDAEDVHVTIDRINGPYPWAPAGEAPYLFGYGLTEQLARSHGESLLGELSERSSARVPFLINGNLENASGRDWYAVWDEWVAATRARVDADLERIRSRPVSEFVPIRLDAINVNGVAADRDGKLLAYGAETSDRAGSLYVLEVESGVSRRLADKRGGTSLAFSPDSRFLFYSTEIRQKTYYEYAELHVWSFERGSAKRLTSFSRSRDPDVSRDGTRIAFVRNLGLRQEIRVADLFEEDGWPEIREEKAVFVGEPLEQLGSPRFSPDGERLVFTRHAFGEVGNDLVEADLHSGATHELLAEGDNIRFPVFGPEGALYFSCDASGVDNICRLDPSPVLGAGATSAPREAENGARGAQHVDARYASGSAASRWLASRSRAVVAREPLRSPTSAPREAIGNEHAAHSTLASFRRPTSAPREAIVITNTTTGLWFPAVSGGDLWVASYSAYGWNLGRTPLPAAPSGAPAIQGPPEMAQVEGSDPPEEVASLEARSYSPWRSLLPRVWYPRSLIEFSAGSFYFGGGVQGFDAVERHSYDFAAGVGTDVKKADLSFAYRNRVLGPSLSGRVSNVTTGVGTAGGDLYFVRELSAGAGISYLWRWTRASLQAESTWSAARSFGFLPTISRSRPVASSRWVPEADLGCVYSNAERPRLAVSPERGHVFRATGRGIFPSGSRAWKLFVGDEGYLPIGNHAVLVPRGALALISRTDPSLHASNVVVAGSYGGRVFNRVAGTSIEQIGIRGYPSQFIYAKSAGQGSVEFRFPVQWIYRGMGTNPFFVEHLSGFVFLDTVVVPGREVPVLPATGGGLTLENRLFLHLNADLSLQLHQGLRRKGGGATDLLFAIQISGVDL